MSSSILITNLAQVTLTTGKVTVRPTCTAIYLCEHEEGGQTKQAVFGYHTITSREMLRVYLDCSIHDHVCDFRREGVLYVNFADRTELRLVAFDPVRGIHSQKIQPHELRTHMEAELVRRAVASETIPQPPDLATL